MFNISPEGHFGEKNRGVCFAQLFGTAACPEDTPELDDPTPMPESALLIVTAHIMAEGGAKHSPFNCNTVNSQRQIAQQAEKQKAERLANAENCPPEAQKIHVFFQNLQK